MTTLIGLLKQCVQSRGTRGVLKIERYAQRLTHKGVYERGKLLLMGSCRGLKERENKQHGPG